jgi:hypothetical protein
MRLFKRLVLLLSIVAGCGNDTSSPVPQPLPFYIRQSTPGDSQPFKLIVGLPKAVAGAGKVHARVQGKAAEATGPSSQAGSFSLALTASQVEVIELRFETAAGLSDPVILPGPQLGFGPVLQGARGPGVVSAPDAGGMVTVSNDGGPGQPPLLQASPSSSLLVSNASSGEVASTSTDVNGVFTARIAGKTGDTITLLLVDSTDETSDFLSFSVQ